MDLSSLPKPQTDLAEQVIAKCIISREYFIREILLVTRIEKWQLEVINALDKGETKISIRSGHGVGKCQSLGCIVPTPLGPRKWSTIKVGDQLFGKNGLPTTVTATYDHKNLPFYDVTFSDGSVATVCEDHLWSVKGRQERRANRHPNEWLTLPTKEILRRGVTRPNGHTTARQWEIPQQEPAQYPAQELSIPPYVLGAWLGDGTAQSGSITNGDNEIWDTLASHYGLSRNYYPKPTARCHTLYGLQTQLRELNLLSNKHVPPAYMVGSVTQRLDLLHGLMDTDGNVSGSASSNSEFNSTNAGLVESVIELARSLGMYAKRCPVKAGWYTNTETGDKVYCKGLHRCRITSSGYMPFSLSRKADQLPADVSSRYTTRWITSIERVADQDGMCVTVSAADSLYLMNDYIVTHNTCMCAWLALHFLLFRDDVKIIVTSPSAKQMTDGLIPEINKWIARLPIWMAAQLVVTSDRITRSPNNTNNFISFRTARKENTEALAGVHAEHVMILVDEASGVAEGIYETGQGALSTKGSIALLIGNPTQPNGFFYKTQTSLTDIWWARKVSCKDSSRVDDSYIANQLRTYGADSREFAVRVLGEFPSSGTESIIPRQFVESAIGRSINKIPHGVTWGVDPGRGGDPTGFVERSANVITDLQELKYVDTMNVVGWIARRWQETPRSLRPVSICIDSIGLGGPIADRLMEIEGGKLPIVQVNVSEATAMSDRFVRLRGELWYAARTWFERKDVSINADLALAMQFVEELSNVNEVLASNGRVDAESKRQMKARQISSPNLADAFCLTLAYDGAISGGSHRGDGWGNVDTSEYVAPHVY